MNKIQNLIFTTWKVTSILLVTACILFFLISGKSSYQDVNLFALSAVYTGITYFLVRWYFSK